MTFSKLAKYLQQLENTASRNEITRILADIFKEAHYDEIDKICYLLLGRIAPQYEGTEFNFAEKMMARAIALATDTDKDKVMQEYKKTGDLGDVAEQIRNKAHVTSNKLSVNEVFETLREVALEGGKNSQERKLQKVSGLLKAVDPLSAKYIVRIPVGKLRLGFSDITMMDAMSVVEAGDKSARKEIEAAYSITSDIGKIIKTVKEHGLKGLSKVKVIAGVPIRTSLAERLPTADKIMEKLAHSASSGSSGVAIEPKLDGFRSQIHVWSLTSHKASRGEKRVSIFSRNHENVTAMFPEIVEAGKKLPVESAIFDGESIAYNPKTGVFYPFQETVQRKRKHGIAEKAAELPLKVFVFDILELNGESLIEKPFSERRKILETRLKFSENKTFVLIEHHVVKTAKEIRNLFDSYSKSGFEGLMAKKLDVTYQAGGRGYHWVKYKKNTGANKNDGSKIADTIDCVLMGAYRGRGKRATFGVGGFLIGLVGRDKKYYTLTNLGTGLTDEQFREMYKIVRDLEVKVRPADYVVDKMVVPDIWVRPKVVLEILADEITTSPRHTAGRNPASQKLRGASKGYSVRFPRLIRVRTDKDPEQATSVHELEVLYKMQTRKN